jgi:glycosyltransferase involved in cell wall biosynthesis
MTEGNETPVRVLYSFPHKMGAGGVCYAAYQFVCGLHEAGADVTVYPGVLHRPLPDGIRVLPTISRGKLRLPYKFLGRDRTSRLHDWIVSRRLATTSDRFDIVHGFAMGSLMTFRMARQLGIPTALDRCNAHTGYAYEAVEKECASLGITLPPDHPHAFNAAILRYEEAEYREADYIMCPSEFVARTFEEKGYSRTKLERFRYGFDEQTIFPPESSRTDGEGLKVLFAAGCAPRKGLHYALDAWLKSGASDNGEFLVVGEFVPGYAEMLAAQLSHPSVKILGYRNDLADIMRSSDVLVLPSIEEGSALVTYDARGCGCVLLVSDSTGAICEHGKNALVHACGDTDALASHFDLLDQDRATLTKLRDASLATAGDLTWKAAGRDMLQAYRRIIARHRAAAEQEISSYGEVPA